MPTPDIQNSERLLDLSNQLNDSITERRKLLKGINAEEQQYFATVKQQQKLSQDIAANAEKYLGYQIKSKDLAKQIKATEDNIAKSKKAFNTIQGNITKQYQEAVKSNSKLLETIGKEQKYNASISNELDRRVRKYNDLKTRREQGEQISARELRLAYLAQKSLAEKVRESNTQLNILEKEQQKQEDIAKTAAEIIKNGEEARKAQEEELAFLKENEKIRKRIEKSTGLLGGLSKALSKIPGVGQYLNADEAITEMEKLAAEIEEAGGKATSFGNRLQIGLKGASTLAKGFYENIKSPEAIFTFIVTQAIKANKETVELGKSLGYGAEKAYVFRENIAEIARNSSNANVTAASLTEAFSQLAESTGLVYEYSADQLETQVKLTKQVGLQADEAAQIQKFGVLTGKTSEETYRSFVRGLVASRNQFKVGVDFKKVLAEAAKVSGQLAASLGYNPERIGKAVVAMKAFGTTLEQAQEQGKQLLNFESSLENELKAELLTGQQLNLERARAAALMNDHVTLAKELSNQGMTLEKFSSMNRLAQEAYAEALGLSADALSDQLQKQKLAQESGKSLAQIQEEEAAAALERQTIQDQFNQSITKLQSLIGNLLSGPLGTMLDVLVKILNVVNLILQPFTLLANLIKESTAASVTFLGVLGGIYAMKNKTFLIDKATVAIEAVKKAYKGTEIAQEGLLATIKKRGFFKTLADAAMSAFKSLAAIPIVGPVLGATAAAGAVALGMKLFSKGDDVMSEGGYGKRTLLAPEGAIRLNDKDTVIAGTNLGGGEGNIAPQIDLTPMIAAINAVKASVDRLYSKDTSVNMDGKKVGTTLTQGSYKVA